MTLHDRISERAAQLAQPLHAIFELTHRCNLRCRFCYLRSQCETEEMSAQEVCGALRQLARAGTLFLSFTGGEIFLREDLWTILGRARELGFAVDLLTNGILIDAEAARRLSRLGPHHVHVSLHGAKERHDAIVRKNGAFAAAVRAIDRLRAEGLRVIVKTVLTRPALGDIDVVRRLAEERGCQFVMSSILVPAFDGARPPADLAASERELVEALPAEPIAPHPRPRATDPVCNAGRSLVAISPSGDVRACLTLRESAGNLRSRPLEEIWRDSPVMRRYRASVCADRADCAACAVGAFCTFCPGSAEQETGLHTGAAPSFCRRAQALADAYAGRKPGAPD